MAIAVSPLLAQQGFIGDTTSGTSTSIDFTAGCTYVLIIDLACSGTASVVSSISGGGITWTARGSGYIGDGVSATDYIKVYTGICPASTSGGITVNITKNSVTYGDIYVDEISGAATTSSVVQAVTSTGTTNVSSKTATLAAFSSSSNSAYSYCVSSNSPASRLSAEGTWTYGRTPIDGGEFNSSAYASSYINAVDTTATWTSTSGVAQFVVFAMEIAAPGAGPSAPNVSIIFMGL